MAASPVNQNSIHHFRSNSFPTREHPLISEFNDQLSRLRCSEATSSSSTSLSQKLIGLQDLHDCVDNLLLLPVAQALAKEQHEKLECTHELQSTLRRRQGCKMELAREVEKYLASRKIAGSKLQSKSSSWFVVSKLVHPKRIASEGEETDANEFEKVDAALQSLIRHKTSKSDYSMHVQNVQNWMGQLESSIQDVEEVLECLSRHLVKTRVSFLNILNH
uniref:Uncharacterized protein n=1 Tax=Fagus sylvatica TaxID=28930 RepID=A0A2N9J6X2_FAGSY